MQDGPPFQLRVVAAEGAMGSGVRAQELIPKGSVVCEYTGELIRGQEMKIREKVSRCHSQNRSDGVYCLWVGVRWWRGRVGPGALCVLGLGRGEPWGEVLSEGCEPPLLYAVRRLQCEALRVLGARALPTMQVMQQDDKGDVVRCGRGQVYMAAGLYYLFDLEVGRYCSMPYVPTLLVALPFSSRFHTLLSNSNVEGRA